MSATPDSTLPGVVAAAAASAAKVGDRQLKRKRAIRKPYCLPCKERRVICTMERPACVRCQRKTRTHECVYEVDLEPRPRSSLSNRSSISSASPRSPPRNASPLVLSRICASSSQSEPVTLGSFWEREFEELRKSRYGSTMIVADTRRASTGSLIVAEPKICRSHHTIVENSSLSEPLESFQSGIEDHCSDFDKYVRSSLIRKNLAPPKEQVFQSAFFNQWLPSSLLLAFPHMWPSSIEGLHTTMPSVNAAVQAIGALNLSHRVQASAEYSNCIHHLIPKVQANVPTGSRLEICITILLLICYELINGARMIDFRRHIAAVAVMLRQETVLIKSGAYSEIGGTDMGRLMVRSFRNIETTESCLQQCRPRLTIDEWNTLLPLRADASDYERDSHLVFEYMNMTSHVTATDMPVNLTDIASLRDAVFLTMQKDGYPGSLHRCPTTSTVIHYLGVQMPTPYSGNLYVPAATLTAEHQRSTMTSLLLTTHLQLLLHLPSATPSSILAQVDELVRLVQYIIASSERGKGRGLPWAIYSLSTVKRALDRIGVSDERYLWADTLMTATYRTMLN